MHKLCTALMEKTVGEIGILNSDLFSDQFFLQCRDRCCCFSWYLCTLKLLPGTGDAAGACAVALQLHCTVFAGTIVIQCYCQEQVLLLLLELVPYYSSPI